jgi:hypothetical protein
MQLKKPAIIEEHVPKGVYFALIGVIVAACIVLGYRYFAAREGLDTSKYQMITLTSGESYIGKLSRMTSDYLVLDDVYYQQQAKASEPPADASQITVLQLSDTVAKPENTMRIAHDKVVHWENLSDDSKIVQAIKQASSTR